MSNFNTRKNYRGQIFYWVKGLRHVLFRIFHSIGERGRKRRECKFQNKAHTTFDSRNTLNAVHKCLFATPPIILALSPTLSQNGVYKCILHRTAASAKKHPSLIARICETRVSSDRGNMNRPCPDARESWIMHLELSKTDPGRLNKSLLNSAKFNIFYWTSCQLNKRLLKYCTLNRCAICTNSPFNNDQLNKSAQLDNWTTPTEHGFFTLS